MPLLTGLVEGDFYLSSDGKTISNYQANGLLRKFMAMKRLQLMAYRR
jgi:hypothetical protein